MISLSYFTRGSIDSIPGLPQEKGDDLLANDQSRDEAFATLRAISDAGCMQV
jgi:hypothetical protein